MCVCLWDPVSNRAKVLICHQRAAWLSLSCQSSNPRDKHSASNTMRGRERERERMRDGGGKKGRQEGRTGSEGAKKRMRDKKKDGKKVKEEAGVEGRGESEGQKDSCDKSGGRRRGGDVSTPLLCVFRAPQVNGEWNF